MVAYEAGDWDTATGLLEDGPIGSTASRCRLAHLRRLRLDWEHFDQDAQLVREASARGDRCLEPAQLLLFPLAASLIKKSAARFAKIQATKSVQVPKCATAGPGLTVGWITSDLKGQHTTNRMLKAIQAHFRLTSSVFAIGETDKSWTDTTITITTTTTNDGWRDATSWQLYDLRLQSTEQRAYRICSTRPSILIDLNGFSPGGDGGLLHSVCSRGTAPCATALEYSSSSGGIGAAYAVVDHCSALVSENEFSEKRILMPHAPFPAAAFITSRETPEALPGVRRLLGVDQDTFIMGCFNSLVKLYPTAFAVWSNLLRLPKVSLWLQLPSAGSEDSLKPVVNEMLAAGHHKKRLVASARAPAGLHHAIKAAADIFVDTPLYSAHSTASDVIWSGVPIVSSAHGVTMASRVSVAVLGATLASGERISGTGWKEYEDYCRQLIDN